MWQRGSLAWRAVRKMCIILGLEFGSLALTEMFDSKPCVFSECAEREEISEVKMVHFSEINGIQKRTP